MYKLSQSILYDTLPFTVHVLQQNETMQYFFFTSLPSPMPLPLVHTRCMALEGIFYFACLGVEASFTSHTKTFCRTISGGAVSARASKQYLKRDV